MGNSSPFRFPNIGPWGYKNYTVKTLGNLEGNLVQMTDGFFISAHFLLYQEALPQRWASTLANRSNARHRSNIRAPPTPPPPRCMYTKCGNLCGQRGRKRFIASWGLRMSHICLCTPCPSPKGIGQRSKVVILPTTALPNI